MRTFWTAPNGTADVVRVAYAGYLVRVKKADGAWLTLDRIRDFADAKRFAREVDRFRPDGSGRFAKEGG